MARTTGGDVIIELMATTAELKESMKGQSEVMAEVSQTMAHMSRVMGGVSTGMRNNTSHLGKLARLLGGLAKRTEAKFDEVEERLDRLEASSGK